MKLRRAIDDEERVAALHQYGILDTRPEPEYDRITELLRSSCGMSKSAISLVDLDRQWFKAREGLDVSETPRCLSFCSVAMHLFEPLVVEDTHHDRRFAHNPFVTGEPHIRFYAGAPLVSSEGFPLGAVCLIDTKPRSLLPWQLQLLSSARDWVQASLEVRRLSRLLEQDSTGDQVARRKLEQCRSFAQRRVGKSLSRLLEQQAEHRLIPLAP